MRLDRLLVYLRFARTRSRASAMIEEGHMRLNGAHVLRCSENVAAGDVLTFPWGDEVRIVEILALPERRGPPGMARSHYRDLDRSGESAIAAGQHDD
ncbi:S4 domain-containing protein [Altererythrobacter sp.]